MKIMALVVSLKAYGLLRVECSPFYLLNDWCGPRSKVCVPQSGSRKSGHLSMADCGEGGGLATAENGKVCLMEAA